MPARGRASSRTRMDVDSADSIDAGAVKKAILNRLHGRTLLPELVGLDAPFDSVFSLLSRTVASAEGNTALLIGPRGSGKSSIVQKSLDMLERNHRGTQQTSGTPSYHVVRLNGFIHTNDKIALRDIARQLLIKQDLEDILIGSFSDAFTYILNLMRTSGDEASMPPVLFILEEFDLLAQHPKQSLLYTLFDIAQSQQTPIAVLGVTARIDVMDLLEKRVKSRFSHRQIHACNAKTLDDFILIARVALSIHSSDQQQHQITKAFADTFNSKVSELLSTESVLSYISEVFDIGKDIRQVLRTFVVAVSKISDSQPYIDIAHVKPAIARERESAKMQILGSISLLDLCLIISMKSLVQSGNSKYNFEMVYNEYKTFMSRHMIAASGGGAMKVYKKPVALKAFETLVELEIVRPILTSAVLSEAGSGASGRNDLLAGSAQGVRAPKEYRMVQLMLEPGQVLELVSQRLDVPVVIKRWAQQ
ncbi:origin recognition complex subunit 4 [Coemansia erecta]|uniref:Origin recognition complex subunit 4 n=1 Tax=Coemansia erecta TaxID=147472 RepID=A0A9W7Y5K9_9FUNG|nr:origin recognition complex subunit 4 [Coemansia erecta]